jgi:hypothetical protein|tara:strand:- start:108 stop:530 length:423 start_codon:yes stop_codon:yes gene_type:complete
MRPFYESQAHRDAEEKLRKKFERASGYYLHKVPFSYGVDYACTDDDQVKAFAELKVRTNKYKEYPTYLLSYQKCLKAQYLKKTVYLVVQFEDGAYKCNLTNVLSGYNGVWMGGRKDRNDWMDIEPCVHIPIGLFTPLKNE